LTDRLAAESVRALAASEFVLRQDAARIDWYGIKEQGKAAAIAA
jgi:hypothetical protein